jgi:tetratricopeptide (TPR) repeat protein
MSSSIQMASTGVSSLGALGRRIRVARKGLGMTQQDLAAPRFGKAYVSAIERGTVRPSLKALEYLAERLGIPASTLISAQEETAEEPELRLAALEEDLRYQIDYAKMLIRSNQVDKAFQAIAEAQHAAQPYWDRLATNVRYLLSFTRGRAYIQLAEPALARPELEEALKLAKGDEEAVVRARNLLGVVFYELEQPRIALDEHLKCLEPVRNRIKDPNLRMTVYRNLANDYFVLNEPSEAIGIYREALTLLEDLDDLQSQAGIFWGMAMAYRAQNNWAQAKLYASRAIHIYEAADNRSDAATIGTNLAEILIDEQRYADAEQVLDRARRYLADTGDKAQSSFLFRAYADMARRQGRLDAAAEYADQSVKVAEEGLDPLQAADNRPQMDAIRAHAEALHISALVQEAMGHREAADDLFRRSLEKINQTSVIKTIRSINLSYAEVLQARGDFERAVEHYRNASNSRIYGARHND